MDKKWLIEDKLLSLDGDRLRVEIGPQVVELACTDENLRDSVTSKHYKIGGRDATGRFIRPDEFRGNAKAKQELDDAVALYRAQGGAEPLKKGETMRCVDHRARHVPHLWKVYELQETSEPEWEAYGTSKRRKRDKDGNVVNRKRFIKVGEVAGLVEAITLAETL